MFTTSSLALSLAVLSALAYGGVDAYVKHFMNQKLNIGQINVLQALLAVLLVGPSLFWLHAFHYTLPNLLIFCLVGLLFSLATWAYFKTFQFYSFGIGSALVTSAALFTLLGGVLIGLDVITWVGVVFLVGLVILLFFLEGTSTNVQGTGSTPRRYLFYPLLSAAGYGFGTAGTAWLLQHGITNPPTFFVYLFVFEGLFFALLFRPTLPGLISHRRLYQALLGRSVLVILGDLALFYALLHYASFAALIEAVHETTVIFSLFLGYWLFHERYTFLQWVCVLLIVFLLGSLYLF